MSISSAQEADIIEKIRLVHRDVAESMSDESIRAELVSREKGAKSGDIVDRLVLTEYETEAARRGLLTNPKKKRLVAGGKVPKKLSKTMAKRKAKQKKNPRSAPPKFRRSRSAYVGNTWEDVTGYDRRFEKEFFGDTWFVEVDGVYQGEDGYEVVGADEGTGLLEDAIVYDIRYGRVGSKQKPQQQIFIYDADQGVDAEPDILRKMNVVIEDLSVNPGKPARVKNPCIGLHFHGKDANELLEAVEKSNKRQAKKNPRKKKAKRNPAKPWARKGVRRWVKEMPDEEFWSLPAVQEHPETSDEFFAQMTPAERREFALAKLEFKMKAKNPRKKKATKRKATKRKRNPEYGMALGGNIHLPTEATPEEVAEILNQDERIARELKKSGYVVTHGLGRKVYADMLLNDEVPGWKMWKHSFTYQPVHGWPEDRWHYRLYRDEVPNPRKKKASKKNPLFGRKKKGYPKRPVQVSDELADKMWKDFAPGRPAAEKRGTELGKKFVDKGVARSRQSDTVTRAIEDYVLKQVGMSRKTYDRDRSAERDLVRLSVAFAEKEVTRLTGLTIGDMRMTKVKDAFPKKGLLSRLIGNPQADVREPNPRKKNPRKKKATKKKTLKGRAERAGKKIEKGAKKAARKTKEFAGTKSGYATAGAFAGGVLLGPIGAGLGVVTGQKLYDNPSGRRRNPSKADHRAIGDRKWSIFEEEWGQYSLSNSSDDLLAAYTAILESENHYRHAGVESGPDGRGYIPAGAEAAGIQAEILARFK